MTGDKERERESGEGAKIADRGRESETEGDRGRQREIQRGTEGGRGKVERELKSQIGGESLKQKATEGGSEICREGSRKRAERRIFYACSCGQERGRGICCCWLTTIFRFRQIVCLVTDIQLDGLLYIS